MCKPLFYLGIPISKPRVRQAMADVFDYIEVFYNRKRRHAYLGDISPVEFEKQTVGLN